MAKGLIHKLKNKSDEAIKKTEAKPKAKVKKDVPAHKSGYKNTGVTSKTLSTNQAEAIRKREQMKKKKAAAKKKK